MNLHSYSIGCGEINYRDVMIVCPRPPQRLLILPVETGTLTWAGGVITVLRCVRLINLTVES